MRTIYYLIFDYFNFIKLKFYSDHQSLSFNLINFIKFIIIQL